MARSPSNNSEVSSSGRDAVHASRLPGVRAKARAAPAPAPAPARRSNAPPSPIWKSSPTPIRPSGVSNLSPPPGQFGSAPTTVREYRERIMAIYAEHEPAKNTRVDYLLQKYQGQEDYLYRTVCQKYGKNPGDLHPRHLELPSAAANSGLSGEGGDSAKGARTTAPATTRATGKAPAHTAKSLPGHVPPALRTKGAAMKQPSNVPSKAGGAPAEDDGGKMGSNGRSLAAGVAAASARLLADIDRLLIGDSTGFFDDPMGDVSSRSDSASGESSSGEDDDMQPDSSATGVNSGRDAAAAAIIAPSKAASAALAGSRREVGSKEVLLPKVSAVEPEKLKTEDARKAALSNLATTPKGTTPHQPPPLRKPPPAAVPASLREAPPPRLREAAPPPLREAGPPPLRKAETREAAPPPLRDRPKAVAEREAAAEGDAAAADVPPAAQADASGGAARAEDAEDSDLDDDDLSAALAAGLAGNAEAGSPDKAKPDGSSADSPDKVAAKAGTSSPAPPPLSSRGEKRGADDDSEKPGNGVLAARPKKDGAPPPLSEKPGADAPSSPGAKAGKPAWGAPPPLRAKGQGRDQADENRGASNGAKTNASSSAVAPEEPEEQPPPPLFDQWLAVLKFLSGWNDQKKNVPADEIKGALCEYLMEEGIENAGTTQRICSTIVPLLSDVRRTDAAVMKNVKTEILKGLKIIQIYILRIVTFELCRERDAKGKGGEEKKKSKKGAQEGAPYLASDISSLAKTVQHFRFESAFSSGLQKLIVAIRAQPPAPPKKDKSGAAECKKSEAESGDTSARKRKTGDTSAEDASAPVKDKGSSTDNAASGAKKSTAESTEKASASAERAPVKRQRRTV